MSSGADDITGLKELSGCFRAIWMVKEKGPSDAGPGGAGDGLKVTIQCLIQNKLEAQKCPHALRPSCK